MNIKEIKEMITLMNENNLTELEIEKEGMRIKLRKAGQGEVQGGPFIIEKEVMRDKSLSSQAAGLEAPVSKTVEIKSPMVGTFYRAPSPETSAYVEIGQTIEPGQVICIIEAMKLMNEIKSEIRGRITDILVENAEPVEFGQPLFLVEPL